MSTSLRILSYNIHKGFTSFNSEFVLEKIRESIRKTDADLLCLQEVMGSNHLPSQSQFEFLADNLWPHFAYGKNASYPKGHHGNAILSKYPIVKWENINLSTNRFEKRGLLHVEIEIPRKKSPLHVFCTHLNLFERSRKKQIIHLCEKIHERVPPGDPIVLAGDFNDWRETLTDVLNKTLGIQEAYHSLHGSHSPTYPSWLPKLRIDRIYHSGLKVHKVYYFKGSTWKKLSDHLPVMAEFNWLD